jgi:localization factor PodJL
VALLLEATRSNNTAAMRILATVFATGAEGVPADPERALALLNQSIAAGEAVLGASALGDFYRLETPKKDIAKAMSFYQKAADGSNTDAMVKLADMLSGSKGVAPDYQRAEALLGKAMALGAAGFAGDNNRFDRIE